MKYAVIYARYSSDRQNEMSIDGQIAECRRYAEAHDLIVVQEYIDKAYTATTDKRPAFLKMIADSAEKTFDTILVYQLDRFARNKDDSGYYKKILRMVLRLYLLWSILQLIALESSLRVCLRSLRTGTVSNYPKK
ncbi:MAG: recombinase family protein [Firmicutes bacterium]|nr:recombinase family protein [Bacillota bacterium]